MQGYIPGLQASTCAKCIIGASTYTEGAVDDLLIKILLDLTGSTCGTLVCGCTTSNMPGTSADEQVHVQMQSNFATQQLPRA